MKANSRKEGEIKKFFKSKDFKREIVPSLLLNFAWIAWYVSWIHIRRQSNLPPPLGSKITNSSLQSSTKRREEKKGQKALKHSGFHSFHVCVCMWADWLGGRCWGQGRCSCGGKHQSRPRPWTTPRRTLFSG